MRFGVSAVKYHGNALEDAHLRHVLAKHILEEELRTILVCLSGVEADDRGIRSAEPQGPKLFRHNVPLHLAKCFSEKSSLTNSNSF